MSKHSHGFRFALTLLIAFLVWTVLFQSTDRSVLSVGRTALASELPVPAISGEAAVVLDGNNGDILYQKNAHAHYAPASITKIVTAIVALDEKGAQLDERIPIDFDSYEIVLETNGTVMGLKPGDNPTLRDLLYGLMLPSGADAALAIARYVGSPEDTVDLSAASVAAPEPSAGTVDTRDIASSPAVRRFVDMMNEKMHELGLTDSHFVNPHGIDEPDHYSSAYDMAALSYYGLKNATFRDLADTVKYVVTGTRTYEVWNLNRLLYNYDGADGIKIGYTDNALETIVASATRAPFKLIVSVMYSNNRYGDARALMDYYFDALANGTVARLPIPKPIPTASPLPTSTPISLEATPVLTPTAAINSPTPAASGDAWSRLGAMLGGFFRAIGLGQ